MEFQIHIVVLGKQKAHGSMLALYFSYRFKEYDTFIMDSQFVNLLISLN